MSAKGQTYRSRGRVYCADSGTVPHPSDLRGLLVRGSFTRAWCSCCEREVALLRNGCLSHHGGAPRVKTLDKVPMQRLDMDPMPDPP